MMEMMDHQLLSWQRGQPWGLAQQDSAHATAQGAGVLKGPQVGATDRCHKQPEDVSSWYQPET